MTTEPLYGRNFLVTAYDLEHSEHRGIAVYSKSLIRCLHEAGAEVWLLTEYFDKLSEKGLRKLPKSTQELIRIARILNSLAQGQRDLTTSPIQRKFKPLLKALKLKPYLRFLINILRRPRNYKSFELKKFQLEELYDNPYVRIERLDYLKCVTGVISAPELYMASQLAAHLSVQRPVRIDLQGFDIHMSSEHQSAESEHFRSNDSRPNTTGIRRSKSRPTQFQSPLTGLHPSPQAVRLRLNIKEVQSSHPKHTKCQALQTI